MDRPWILKPAARIGLFILILSLGLLIIASQAEQLAIAVRFDALVQSIVNLWQDYEVVAWQMPLTQMLDEAAFVVLFGWVIALYFTHFKPRSLHKRRGGWLLILLLLLFAGLAWVMSIEQTLLIYLFPMATLSIITAILFDAHLSILLTALMGLMLGHLAGGSLELGVYATMGGLIGVLSVGRARRLNRLLWAGAYVALSNILVILIFHFVDSQPSGLIELMAVGIANGIIAAALALMVSFLGGNLLGIATSVQLLDLTQPTHPLLRQLVLRAPGTYHHSLLVSNLAEQAAEQIGADALLTRVGAYYHDVGKLQHPHIFIENQSYIANVHDQLDPDTSGHTILDHVEHGLKLAKKYRLPAEVRAFIAEHHGTGLVEHFYHQALNQAARPEQVNEADFRYSGPKPQSKETAIVMLADSCEAVVRATKVASVEELDQLVHDIIMHKVSSGQLDDCDLTLHELELIHNTFVEMLQGAFHQRVEYEQETNKNEEEATTANSSFLPARSPSTFVTTPPSS